MNKFLWLIEIILFVCPITLCGQSIKELLPVPPSICAEASLPAQMQRKLDRIVQERSEKNMRYGQVTDCRSAFLQESFTQYIRHNDTVFYLHSPHFDQFEYTLPRMVITNTSRGHELIKGQGATFNVKKDRLSSVILDDKQCLYIVNRNDHLCDPTLFEFRAEGEGLHMEGNHIVLDASPRELALGRYAMQQRITVTHLASQATYHYDLQLSFADSLSWRGEKKAMAIMAFPTPLSSRLGVMLDLTDQTITFVQLPLTIHGEGTDGVNGHRGYSGANGINASTWTDKNGVKHTTAGTCGKPGGDGENGTDGTDGGQFFIVMDNGLVDMMGIECITAWIDPGLGGEGGKGGDGGIHGSGSGCKGKAPDGKNGQHGKNGQRGDFLYVIGDTQTYINQTLK